MLLFLPVPVPVAAAEAALLPDSTPAPVLADLVVLPEARQAGAAAEPLVV